MDGNKLLEIKSLNTYLSAKFREQALKTTWFNNFKKAYAITRTGREIKENETIANFRGYMLKKKVLTGLKNFVLSESLILQEHRRRSQQELIFRSWYKVIPLLRNENQIWEDKIQVVIDKFRLRIVGPKIMEAWKYYLEKEKRDKEKQKFKKDIMSKVNGWLTEIDDKRNNDI